MRVYEGSIEDVLASGEYDQGDLCVVSYDELYDLAEQGRLIAEDNLDVAKVIALERRTNRPLHPSLGGKSPYSEFLPL